MANDTNNLTIIGRLTKDAELKQTGMSVGFFTIAVNRKKKEETEASFFDVNVLGEYAEMIVPKLKKGTQVCVAGGLKQERWKDKTTDQNRSRVLISAYSVQIIGGNNV